MSSDPLTSPPRPDSVEYKLEPIAARTYAEMEEVLQPPILATEEAPAETKKTYTLAQMLIATTCVGVGLGLIKLFGPAPAAGISGLLVLVGLMMFSVTGEVPKFFFVLWCMLLTLYVMASLMAVVSGFLPR